MQQNILSSDNKIENSVSTRSQTLTSLPHSKGNLSPKKIDYEIWIEMDLSMTYLIDESL